MRRVDGYITAIAIQSNVVGLLDTCGRIIDGKQLSQIAEL